MDDIAFAFVMANMFGWLGCYMGNDEGQTKERQKWCQHYHSEYKKVEGCLTRPDWEVGE